MINKIFISHSSKDVFYIEKIIDILEIIGIKSDQIFCSSFEGYGIELGEDFLERIKNELNDEVLVLFILSENFFNSPISLCEMGATWVKTNEHIPILLPSFEFSDVKGVIPNTQGMKLSESDKLNSLKKKLETLFKIPPLDFSIWERKRNKFLKEIKSKHNIKSNNYFTDNEDSEEFSDSESIIKQKSLNEYPDDYEMQLYIIENQREAVKKLMLGKPDDLTEKEFSLIREKAKIDYPLDFEMRLYIEESQIESLRKLKSM